MKKILIIEDDEAIRVGLKYYLDDEGFITFISSNGKESLEILTKEEINIILLDINLPDINGFDLFTQIKEIKNIPVIFLTADDLEVSIVRGLDMGADDYITKPFKMRELTSRINAILRRTGSSKNIIKIGNIKIDMTAGKVFKNENDVMLTALEYKILLLLALNPKKIFSRENLLAEVWDVNDEYVNDNTLTVYIKRIREKIEDDVQNPKIIITVRKIGYKIGEFPC